MSDLPRPDPGDVARLLFAPLLTALRIRERLPEVCRKTETVTESGGQEIVVECPGVRIRIELSREFVEVMNLVDEEYRSFFRRFYIHTALTVI